MSLNKTLISETERFLKNRFSESKYLTEHPEEASYRLEHSYRVANIGKAIAEIEGFDETEMVIACLLHDISYCEGLVTDEDKRDHGRRSAAISRPFLESLGLADDRINDICFGIAIHVDDVADFMGERTAFAETVSDADNIDRFDVYRIYENMRFGNFDLMSLEDKIIKVNQTIDRLEVLCETKFATSAADGLWKKRLDYYLSFYERLRLQFSRSGSVIND